MPSGSRWLRHLSPSAFGAFCLIRFLFWRSWCRADEWKKDLALIWALACCVRNCPKNCSIDISVSRMKPCLKGSMDSCLLMDTTTPAKAHACSTSLVWRAMKLLPAGRCKRFSQSRLSKANKSMLKNPAMPNSHRCSIDNSWCAKGARHIAVATLKSKPPWSDQWTFIAASGQSSGTVDFQGTTIILGHAWTYIRTHAHTHRRYLQNDLDQIPQAFLQKDLVL